MLKYLPMMIVFILVLSGVLMYTKGKTKEVQYAGAIIAPIGVLLALWALYKMG